MRPAHSWKFLSILVSALGVFMLSTALAGAELDLQNAQVDPDALKKEVERLKNEKEYEVKRVEEMRQEREQMIKEIRRSENQNAKQTKEIEELKSALSEQQETLEARMKKMEGDLKDSNEIKQKKMEPEVETSLPLINPADVEKQANEILQKGGDLDPEDEKFKEELARAHYNMGNVYFERGEYQRSVVEYYQAVDLMPYDADAHYNLAYVSGEFIGDQETALKHYQWYLYLKPAAQDRKLVEEKIVGAKLVGRSHVESRLDKSGMVSGHQNVAR
jgi:tetratricopeptide (TPR) repeat protein